MKPKDFIGKAKYDSMGAKIWATHGENLQMLADVRGCGAIQNLFKKTHSNRTANQDEIDMDAAEKFQDELGQFIVDAINEKIEREEAALKITQV